MWQRRRRRESSQIKQPVRGTEITNCVTNFITFFQQFIATFSLSADNELIAHGLTHSGRLATTQKDVPVSSTRRLGNNVLDWLPLDNPRDDNAMQRSAQLAPGWDSSRAGLGQECNPSLPVSLKVFPGFLQLSTPLSTSDMHTHDLKLIENVARIFEWTQGAGEQWAKLERSEKIESNTCGCMHKYHKL